ncbi:cytochrome P460 family protein [Sphingomonas sp. RT2P30]|uniref:cytochrome P460 family protein n=1 Tax=Parasphingomonas halimpatiens TaxID=3096162 RepID=UPI002FC6EBFA
MKIAKTAMLSRAGLLIVPALLLFGAARGSTAPEPAPAAQYNAAGELILPADYREWVFLTSGLNMNYSDGPLGMDHEMVDNVFVDPVSWKAFKATGRWPDGTVMVKEPRIGSSKGSINKSGIFQTEQRFDLEVHVRDSRRFKGGWAFFVNVGDKPAKAIPASASCYSCHGQHGAVDTTFVQFYPTAKPIAVKAGTFVTGK